MQAARQVPASTDRRHGYNGQLCVFRPGGGSQRQVFDKSSKRYAVKLNAATTVCVKPENMRFVHAIHHGGNRYLDSTMKQMRILIISICKLDLTISMHGT